jgi:alpha-N-acetylglucosamine transferase
MSRGVLYIVWGKGCDRLLERSIASVNHWHPELPVHVEKMPDGSNLHCKAEMYRRSPYDETLFLDADTVVLGRLDYGFKMAQRHCMALTHSVSPWQRRFDKLPTEHNDAIEYSSGVVFFGRDVAEVFASWVVYDEADTSCSYQTHDGSIKRAARNDQALLSLAIHRNEFNPFVLPQNWNLVPKYHKQFFGPILIWHDADNIPKSLIEWNKEQSRGDAVIKAGMLP